jgi:lysophospholipase L1-like esterase
MLDFAPAKFIKVGGTGADTFLTSARPFYFSVAIPEGNYRVTVTFGDPAAPSENTVKAELRRLMIESLHSDAGQTVTKSFIVNVRRPQYPGGAVSLKKPREAVDEFWGWDEKLTIEFNGARPAVRSVAIEPADVPTVFIVGDSTSCDQSKEPWTSWGQMFTNFFKPEIAIANHGESGESVASSLHAHRFDKVYSLLRPGDYVFVQFGHNDMKGGNINTYISDLGGIADEVKKRGGTLVLVTPVERSNGVNTNTLAGYPDAVRQVAKARGVALVDLHDLSQALYRAIGDNLKAKAFQDGTHHNKYGAYEIAKCVVLGVQQTGLPLAKFIVDGFAFDPTKPDPVADFAVPASGVVNPSQRPAGD